MQLSLESADAPRYIPTIPSNREVNENYVIQGYFTPKIIILQSNVCCLVSYTNRPIGLQQLIKKRVNVEVKQLSAVAIQAEVFMISILSLYCLFIFNYVEGRIKNEEIDNIKQPDLNLNRNLQYKVFQKKVGIML